MSAATASANSSNNTSASTSSTPAETVQSFEVRKEVMIASTPEIVFASILDELGPGSELPDGSPFPMKIEPWPGGRWYRDRGESGGHPFGHLWCHVQVIKAPTLLELCGPMAMSYPCINHIQYRVKEEGTAVRLTLLHRAMGLIEKQHKEGVDQGWNHGLSRVKQLAERRSKSGR